MDRNQIRAAYMENTWIKNAWGTPRAPGKRHLANLG